MRLIDADKLKAHYSWWPENERMVLDQIVDAQPTIDAAPVVRCGECVFSDGTKPGQPNILCFQMHENDFCSYGKRKDGAE